MSHFQDNSTNKSTQSRRISRRELLQGKLRCQPPSSAHSGVISRFSISGDSAVAEANSSQSNQIRSIAGISVEPVSVREVRVKQRELIPLFRPPGAIEESQFLAGCTRCHDCSNACPHGAIRPALSRLPEVTGTPTIQPDIAACQLCEDFPCIAACQPGVLTRQIPVIMGTASIKSQLCLAFQGTTCTVCMERCPVEGVITVFQGKPVVHESSCTGCGVCRFACPAPENAVLLMPTFRRPVRPSKQMHQDSDR